tara:strand:- start:2954 stop:3409 length:456 start_codon:yes stop_codon:yes gene_type:complete
LSDLVYGHDKEVSDWVAERLTFVPNIDFGPHTSIGVVTETKLIAGVVYHDYHKNFRTIQISMAADSPMWATKRNIKSLLEYPFLNLKVYKVWIGVPADNKRALDNNFHIGFKQEAVLAHYFGPKKHCVMARMLLPDFKRLYGVENGKEFRA